MTCRLYVMTGHRCGWLNRWKMGDHAGISVVIWPKPRLLLGLQWSVK